MSPLEERWEILEKIGDYVAGELGDAEAREAERLILEDSENGLTAYAYALMLVAFLELGQGSPSAPAQVTNNAVRWAYLSDFLRRASGGS